MLLMKTLCVVSSDRNSCTLAVPLLVHQQLALMNIVFQGFELVHFLQEVYFCLTFSSFAPLPNFFFDPDV